MGGLFGFAPLGGGLFLGWVIGANDSANVFGTAVATRIITLRTACVLCALAVMAGAGLQGAEGIRTLSGITHQTIPTAVVVSLAAALTGTVMTYLRIPISTSQAVVGAILGIGLATRDVNFRPLVKVIVCWIGTPIGSMLIAMIVYKLLGWIIEHVPMSIFTRDKLLWSGLIIVGVYGSYALGANNVTNSTGIFSGLIEGVSDAHLALIGGFAISVGAVTYSKRVIASIGSGIVRLDAFTALVAVLAMSVTVHIFAIIGAPVSTSQGIVGAILGIGVLRGAQGIRFGVLRNIAVGWLMTPLLSLVLAAAGYAIFVGH
jgi:inorganic phosphate transporter, PiT family